MEKIILFNEENKPNSTQKNEIIDFLYEHLDEFGDAKTQNHMEVLFYKLLKMKEHHLF
jgi:hypothetical protein